jgi:hypothetical protein
MVVFQVCMARTCAIEQQVQALARVVLNGSWQLCVPLPVNEREGMQAQAKEIATVGLTGVLAGGQRMALRQAAGAGGVEERYCSHN